MKAEDNIKEINTVAGLDSDTDGNKRSALSAVFGLLKSIWINKVFILKTCVLFIVLGLIYFFLSPNQYSAGCIMVPQTGESKTSGNITNLAAMAGIDLGSMGSTETLSPIIYPRIIGSTPFKRRLMHTPLEFKDIDRPISLYEYYTNDEYRKFNLGASLKKYTISLPGVIVSAVKGKPETNISPMESGPLYFISEEERKCGEVLSRLLTIMINEKEGYIMLNARFTDPYIAAQLAHEAQVLLQEYITDFKNEKVESNLEFVQERYLESKEEFENIQTKRADYYDKNQHLTSARAKIERERMDSEYNLAFTVYNELAKQLEQAKIKVKETTPMLTVISPITVPLKKDSPRGSLVMVFSVFLALVLSIGFIVLLPALTEFFETDKIIRVLKIRQ